MLNRFLFAGFCWILSLTWNEFAPIRWPLPWRAIKKNMMRGCCSCLGIDTVDGRNPAPPGINYISTGAGFFHEQYHNTSLQLGFTKNYPPKIWKGIFCWGLGTLLVPTLFGLKPTGGQYFALQLLQHQSRTCPANLAFSFHCLAAQRRVDHGDNVDVSLVYTPED